MCILSSTRNTVLLLPSLHFQAYLGHYKLTGEQMRGKLEQAKQGQANEGVHQLLETTS